jgi:hypothetical protein
VLACGAIGAEIAEQHERQRHTKKFVFDDSAEKLWKEMGIAAREAGAVCPDEIQVGETVHCGGDDGALERKWMNVRLTKVEGGHMIEMIHMSERKEEEQWKPQPGRRANDLEFTLISRLHPDKAAAISEAAEAKRPEGKVAGEQVQKLAGEAYELEKKRQAAEG